MLGLERFENFLSELLEKWRSICRTCQPQNCSRLAWLYLNIGNSQRALDVVKVGVERDPANEHCQKPDSETGCVISNSAVRFGCLIEPVGSISIPAFVVE